MIKSPSDNLSYRYPVSIKGIVLIDGKIPLLKNEREEFELPGGKLEIDEQPEECVCREIQEELSITVKVDSIIDSWLYRITKDVNVIIITYGCTLIGNAEQLTFSHEHKSLIMADLKEIEMLNMPDGYKKSISNWARRFLLNKNYDGNLSSY